MTCALQVPGATGHVTLSWDPDDADQVRVARLEFDALKSAGFAFYTEADKERRNWKAGDGKLRAERRTAEIVRTFEPRRRRTVAIRPQVGG
jgi:hypothetical protein